MDVNFRDGGRDQLPVDVGVQHLPGPCATHYELLRRASTA